MSGDSSSDHRTLPSHEVPPPEPQEKSPGKPGPAHADLAQTPVNPRPDNALSETAVDLSTVRFRPQHRPPTAVLWVMDDDQQSAERFRIRGSTYSIGRVRADLLLPHDEQVSTTHAEICRRLENGRYFWYLRDLDSTNGTFVKLAKARLRPQREFRIGGRRFSFAGDPAGPPVEANGRVEAHDETTSRETHAWVATPNADDGPAMLVDMTGGKPKGTYPLVKTETGDLWIGRDRTSCWLTLDDPMVSPRHARLYLDSEGWVLEDADSLNGTWLRVDELRLATGSEFELGEQRFRITFPG